MVFKSLNKIILQIIQYIFVGFFDRLEGSFKVLWKYNFCDVKCNFSNNTDRVGKRSYIKRFDLILLYLFFQFFNIDYLFLKKINI
jgi:hypothetical protein